MKIKRNDLVEVIAGDEADRAPRKVLQIVADGKKVLIEGVNRVYKHVFYDGNTTTSPTAGGYDGCINFLYDSGGDDQLIVVLGQMFGERRRDVEDEIATFDGLGPAGVRRQIGREERQPSTRLGAARLQRGADVALAAKIAQGRAQIVARRRQLQQAMASHEAGAAGDENDGHRDGPSAPGVLQAQSRIALPSVADLRKQIADAMGARRWRMTGSNSRRANSICALA